MISRTRAGAPLATWIALVAVALCSNVLAQDGDGAYGRFDHAVVFSFDAGFALSTPPIAPRASGALRVRIIDAAGPVLSLSGGGGEPLSFRAGVELRPFWPSLFLLDMSTGIERIDLLIGSIGVELGVAYVQNHGIGVTYAFGIEMPLALPTSSPSRVFDGLRLRFEARRIRLRQAQETTQESYRAWEMFFGLNLRLGAGAPRLHSDPRRSHDR